MKPEELDKLVSSTYNQAHIRQDLDADYIEENYDLLHTVGVDNFIEAAGILDFTQRSILNNLANLGDSSKDIIKEAIRSKTAELQEISIKELLNTIESAAYARIDAIDRSINGDSSTVKFLKEKIDKIEAIYQTHSQEGRNGKVMPTENVPYLSPIINEIRQRIEGFRVKAAFNQTETWYRVYKTCQNELHKAIPEFGEIEKLHTLISHIKQYRTINALFVQKYPEIAAQKNHPLSLDNKLDTNKLFDVLGQLGNTNLKTVKNVSDFFGISFADIRRSSKTFHNEFKEGVDFISNQGNSRRYTKFGLAKQLDLYRKYVKFEQNFANEITNNPNLLKNGLSLWEVGSMEKILGEVALVNVSSRGQSKSTAIQVANAYLDKRMDFGLVQEYLYTLETKRGNTQDPEVIKDLKLEETFIRNYFLKEVAATSVSSKYYSDLKNAINSTADFDVSLKDFIGHGSANPFIANIYETTKAHLHPDVTLGEFFILVSSSSGATQKKIAEIVEKRNATLDPTQKVTPVTLEAAEQHGDVFDYLTNPKNYGNIQKRLDLIEQWQDLAKLGSTSISLGYLLNVGSGQRNTTSTYGNVQDTGIVGNINADLNEILPSRQYFAKQTSVRDFISGIEIDEEEEADGSAEIGIIKLHIDAISNYAYELGQPEITEERYNEIKAKFSVFMKNYENTTLGYVFSVANLALFNADVTTRENFYTAMNKLLDAIDNRTAAVSKAKGNLEQ